MKTLNELFRDVIYLNEVGGDESRILKFSDPDGPSGRSGWSFGLCQFDTKHNSSALNCLRECGFTEEEISDVTSQGSGSKELESKLQSDIVDRYDTSQLSTCINSALNVTTSHGIMVLETPAILALADYINQYGSVGIGFISYLEEKQQTGILNIQIIQDWKLNTTLYGKNHPSDCIRRYNNILKVVKDECS